MRKARKNYTPVVKVTILKRHLVDKVPVSDLCDEYQWQPNLFYGWQKQFFENGATAFQKPRRQADDKEQRIAFLEQKLVQKNEVVAELVAEHVQLKKEFGEL